MSSNPGDAVVRNNEEQQRYELEVDGRLAVIEYRGHGEQITLVHTGVPKELEGRGLAGKLARAALDETRARGLAVIPRCPFVAAYLRRHPEYQDLVPAEARQRYLTP